MKIDSKEKYDARARRIQDKTQRARRTRPSDSYAFLDVSWTPPMDLVSPGCMDWDRIRTNRR